MKLAQLPVTGLSVVLFSLVAIANNDGSVAKPNILLIVSDDQGYSDLGCIGIKPVKTPHLDRLAAEGVRATSFYVTWPACTPSRGSVLTGRYPQRNGLCDMVRNDMVNYGHHYTADEYAVSPEMTLGLDPREITLGDVLRSAGYSTGVVKQAGESETRSSCSILTMAGVATAIMPRCVEKKGQCLREDCECPLLLAGQPDCRRGA